MGIIACSLNGTWHTAGCAKTLDITHTATEADGIGRHYTIVLALIGQRDTVEFAVAGIKLESAQINPRAATHLLVDAELRALTFMPNGIERIVDAVGK